MAGFYTALIGTPPTIQWPGLSPPCTIHPFLNMGGVIPAAGEAIDLIATTLQRVFPRAL
jgi:hypothetical protein